MRYDGEASTKEAGKEDKHEQGVRFLVYKDIVNSVIGCRPVSSRLITIHPRASPFNITIIQAYAPTSDYDDDDAVEHFYDQLQEILDQSPKKDILVVLSNWSTKVGEDAFKNRKGTWGRYCNPETNERGLLASGVSLAKMILCWQIHLANTKHQEDGHGTAQMEDTMTRLIISWLGGAS